MPYDPFAVAPVATTTQAPIAATSGMAVTNTLAPTNALAPVMQRPGNDPRKMAMGQFRDARQDWRGQHPMMAAGQSPQDFRALMDTWRQGQPDRQDYWSQGQFGDAYTPAPGNTGIVPPNMLPPTQIGMVPGVPGSMGLNPGGSIMTPGGGGTGAPPQATHDWRTLLFNARGRGF